MDQTTTTVAIENATNGLYNGLGNTTGSTMAGTTPVSPALPMPPTQQANLGEPSFMTPLPSAAAGANTKKGFNTLPKSPYNTSNTAKKMQKMDQLFRTNKSNVKTNVANTASSTIKTMMTNGTLQPPTQSQPKNVDSSSPMTVKKALKLSQSDKKKLVDIISKLVQKIGNSQEEQFALSSNLDRLIEQEAPSVLTQLKELKNVVGRNTENFSQTFANFQNQVSNVSQIPQVVPLLSQVSTLLNKGKDNLTLEEKVQVAELRMKIMMEVVNNSRVQLEGIIKELKGALSKHGNVTKSLDSQVLSILEKHSDLVEYYKQ